jgi:hypothetical protein
MIVVAAAALAALSAAGAGAAPVTAARACSHGNLGKEFQELRAHGMACAAARRAVKRGKFSGGFRARFTTPGFHCRKISGNYTEGHYKCRDGGRVFTFRYRNPKHPDGS